MKRIYELYGGKDIFFGNMIKFSISFSILCFLYGLFMWFVLKGGK